MAEKVQQRLEGMLGELEDLKLKGLFSEEEITALVKKRKQSEFSIARRAPKKQDYIRYIQNEINLETLRLLRKKRLNIKNKTSISDFAGVRHINNLFERALLKFKGDPLLWLQYIDFSQKQGSSGKVTKLFVDAIRLHPSNPTLWIQAATWEFSHNLNMDAARSLMQRGLRLNSTSQDLWHEYFRLELKFCEKIKLRRKLLLQQDLAKPPTGIELPTLDEERTLNDDTVLFDDKRVRSLDTNDPVVNGVLARIIFKHAISAIPNDVAFRVRFIDIYGLFPDYHQDVELIYESLLKDFPQNVEALDVTFRRPLVGLEVGSVAYVDAIGLCIPRYEAHLEAHYSSSLAHVFAKFLWEQAESCQESSLKTFLYLKLKGVVNSTIKRAKADTSTGVIIPEMYLLAIRHAIEVTKSTSRVAQLIKEATSKYPENLELCKLHLSIIPDEDQSRRISVIEDTLKYNCCSAELWSLYFNSVLDPEHATDNASPDSDETASAREELFIDALRKLAGSHITNDTERTARDESKELILRHLLSWAYRTSGISYVRNLAKKVALVSSLTASFYRQWIQIEIDDAVENPHGTKAAPVDQTMADTFRALFDHRQNQVAATALQRISALYESLTSLDPTDLSTWLDYLAFLNRTGPAYCASHLLLRIKTVLPPALYAQLEADYRDFILTVGRS